VNFNEENHALYTGMVRKYLAVMDAMHAVYGRSRE
jgi:hypothetical protein